MTAHVHLLGIMTTKAYRGRYTIIAQMLNIINNSGTEGANKTTIMYKAFLSYAQLKEYLSQEGPLTRLGLTESHYFIRMNIFYFCFVTSIHMFIKNKMVLNQIFGLMLYYFYTIEDPEQSVYAFLHLQCRQPVKTS